MNFNITLDRSMKINDEELSRVLDLMFNSGFSPCNEDTMEVIKETEFSSHQFAQQVLQTMLQYLAITPKVTAVEYCFKCCQYTVNVFDSTTPGCSNSDHYTFRIELLIRKYRCFWGEGFHMSGQCEPVRELDVEEDYFGEGYTPEGRMRISNLKLGEAVTFTDGGIHTVLRTE